MFIVLKFDRVAITVSVLNLQFEQESTSDEVKYIESRICYLLSYIPPLSPVNRLKEHWDRKTHSSFGWARETVESGYIANYSYIQGLNTVSVCIH